MYRGGVDGSEVDVLELGIGVAGLILSAVTYYLGRRQGQASDKKLDALQREMVLIQNALEHSNVRLEEDRDPESGELRDVRVRVVPATAALSVEPVTVRADPPPPASPELPKPPQ
jgi:hypothetical protein